MVAKQCRTGKNLSVVGTAFCKLLASLKNSKIHFQTKFRMHSCKQESLENFKTLRLRFYERPQPCYQLIAWIRYSRIYYYELPESIDRACVSMERTFTRVLEFRVRISLDVCHTISGP